MPIPRLGLLGLLVGLSILPGCEPFGRDALVIATSWPAADRGRIEAEFTAWLRQQAEPSAPGPIRIEWLVLAPGDDLVGLADRRRPPDVLLGGPSRSYERLSREKRLAPLPIEGSPPWAVARQAVIRTVSAPGDARSSPGNDPPDVAFDDPRNDPVSLAWAEAQLARGGFVDGYARLVRAAGDRRRIGRQSGAAASVVERGRAVAVVPADRDNPEPDAIPWPEGVAIVASGNHPARASSFLTFLAETGRARSIPAAPDRGSPEARDLLAELLGATLVDSQDELWAAWAAMKRAGSPPAPLRWMTEPPPWPPASIARILERPGEPAMAMIETLAGELATDAAARAWLISSWLSPRRPIDRAALEELSHAADGRLFREPRFREWLRAEWTAWARQRYRRVLRVVEAERKRP